MLDFEFSNYASEYLSLDIPHPETEGEFVTVKVCKPTEKLRMLISMVSMKQLTIQEKTKKNKKITKRESIEFLDLIEDTIYGILNNNRDDIKFSRGYVRNWFGDLRNMSVLLAKMTQFMEEIAERKN